MKIIAQLWLVKRNKTKSSWYITSKLQKKTKTLILIDLFSRWRKKLYEKLESFFKVANWKQTYQNFNQLCFVVGFTFEFECRKFWNFLFCHLINKFVDTKNVVNIYIFFLSKTSFLNALTWLVLNKKKKGFTRNSFNCNQNSWFKQSV